MWHNFFQKRTVLAGKRAAPKRASDAARLGVERLELRSLLSAVSPWQNEASEPHWEDAPREDDGAWNHHAAMHGSYTAYGDARGGDFSGNFFDGEGSQFSSPDGGSRGPLAAQAQPAYTTYVIYVIRVDAPRGFAGGTTVNSTAGFSEDGGGEFGLRDNDARPLAVKGPPGGAAAFNSGGAAGGASQVLRDLVALSDAPEAWVGADAATARRDDASPLLRALESRDAVFRALAGSTATRMRDLTAGLQSRAMPSAAAKSAAGALDDADRAGAEADEALTLCDLTDAQARDLGDILDRLAADTNATCQGAARRRAAEARTSELADEPAVADLARRDGAATADEAAIDAAADMGGMVLLGAPEGGGAGGVLAVHTAIVDEAFDGPIEIDAAIGTYRAFAVGTTTAGAATATTTMDVATREAASKEGSAAADAAGPSTVQLAGAAVGATVLALRLRKSREDGDNERKLPQ